MNDANQSQPQLQRVLVSDFDGTITDRDFYHAYTERFLDRNAPDFWADYHAGKSSHFDTMASIFGYSPIGEAAFCELLGSLDIEPQLSAAVEMLKAAGWDVVVCSAGCRWYIERLFEAAGVSLEIHSNPGSIDDEGRLQMTRGTDLPFYCEEVGVDKSAVVRAQLEAGRTVAYAGDGMVDLSAALLVPPHLRFARRDLAEQLTRQGEQFRPFSRWSDVAKALVAKTSSPPSGARL